MRWISWFASVRPRTVVAGLLVICVTLIVWRVATGPIYSSAATHRHPALLATTKPDELRISSANQINYDWQAKTVELEITFNRPVDARQILPRLQLMEEGAHRIALRPSSSASSNGSTVRIITEPMARLESASDQTFQLTLLRRRQVDTAISLESLGDVRTIPVATDQRVTDVQAVARADDDPAIVVHFSSPVNLDAIRQALSVEPAVPFTLQSSGGSDVVLTGQFKAAERYAVKIADRATGQDASVYPRGGACTVFLPDRAANVWFDHDSGFLGSVGNRRVIVHAVNVSQLKVTVLKLYDNNLVVWRNLQNNPDDRPMRRHRWISEPDSTPLDQQARIVATKTIALDGRKNEKIDRELSLDDLLPADMRSDGVLRIDVEGKSVASLKGRELRPHYEEDDGESLQSASTLLTLSDIALTAKQSPTGIVVWATSLHTAVPCGQLIVRAYTAENQLAAETKTDRDGLAKLPATASDGHAVALLIAERSASEKHEVSWLDLRGEALALDEPLVHGAENRQTGYDAFVYGDRGVYRPGETVHLRTIVRDVHQRTPGTFPVEFQLKGPDDRSRGTTRAVLDADGSAQWSVNLPAESPTGLWSAVVRLPGDTTATLGTLQFHVEEFIPDRIHVRARFDETANNARHTIGTPLMASVHGDYLFGQPAAKLATTLICRLDPASFAVPKMDGWVFNDDAEAAATAADVHASAVEKRIDDSILDDARQLQQSFDCDAMLAESKHSVAYHGPWLAALTAEVRETGGRAVSDRTSMPVDGVDRYVGMQPGSNSPVAGLSQQILVKLFRPDGSLDAEDAHISVAVDRQIWNTSWSVEGGRFTCRSTRRLEPVTTGQASVVRVHGGVGTLAVNCPEPGEFAVALTDPETNRSVSTLLQVSGDAWSDSVSQEHPESLEVNVVPRPQFSAAQIDALLHPFALPSNSPLDGMRSALLASPAAAGAPFVAGDPVRVVVRSPFTGTLLLSLESDHVLHTQVIAMGGSSVSVPIILDQTAGPNAFVSATVVRAVNPHAAWRVHRAYGIAPVKLDESQHQIQVTIQAPAKIQPEQSLPVSARLIDRNGVAVANAAVTFAVVDEGICQLTHFVTPDPFAYFTRWRQLGVETRDTYSDLMPDTDRTGDVGGDEAMMASADARHSSPVAARRVRSLAMVSDLLHTDADGVVRTSFPLPQFVGKARVMAVSFAGDRFGAAEQSTLVRSDLVVQSSWPRFAAPGDRFRVPLVIFNNSSHNGDAIVRLSAAAHAPLLLPADPALPPIHVDAGRSATISFEVTAAKASGVADVTTNVTLGSEEFHETVSLPIRPAASMQTITGMQTLTPGKSFVVAPPTNLLGGVGQLAVRITQQPSLNLPEGLDYLDRYPYGCAEQTVSESFPLVYLPDLGQTIGGDPYPKEQIRAKVAAALDRLVMMQTRTGALPMWAGGADWPWVSIYAAHFCTVASRAGNSVPAEFSDRLMNYVRAQLDISSDAPDQMERQAYACYVLALAGHADVNAMSRLSDWLTRPILGDAPHPTAQTAFHLAAAWKAVNDSTRADALLPKLQFDTRHERELSGNIGSPVRERAIMLSTLLMIQPEHPQIPALAQSLADAGRAGQWRSTQDVAFAVMALGQYAALTKSVKPFNHAELWSGDVKLASAESGAALTWSLKNDNGSVPLAVHIDGPDGARGYVQWISDGVPIEPSKQPLIAGMEIQRRYLDESGQPIGTAPVRSGQLLNVEITLKCPQPSDGVVIEDLLPAGLEPENPRLDGTRGEESKQERATDGSQQFAVNRQDFRDDRVVLFGDVSEPGTYRCRYRARAVTTGTFVIPPVSAECMYDLSLHGRSAGGGTLTVGSPSVEPTITAAAARAE